MEREAQGSIGGEREEVIGGLYAALESIYRTSHGALLSRVLAIIRGAWGFDTDAISSWVLRGFALVLRKHGDQLFNADFQKKLSKSLKPTQLLGDGRQIAKVNRLSGAAGIAARLVDEYNVGRRTNKIPRWED